MSYKKFNKMLTVKRSSYNRMVSDFLESFDAAVATMIYIESCLNNGANNINCNYPNLSVYVGGLYDKETSTLEVSGKIRCSNASVTIKAGSDTASNVSNESVIIVDAVDNYKPFLSETMVPKDTYHLEANWRYDNTVSSVSYDDLLASHIPSAKQVLAKKIPLKHPRVANLKFVFDVGFKGEKPALKKYCVQNGIAIDATRIKVNTPLVAGEHITIDSGKVYIDHSVSIYGDDVWISDDSIQENNDSILSPTYVRASYARRDLSNISTLFLSRSEVELLNNDSIAKEEIDELMVSKLPSTTDTIPLSTKTTSSSSKHVVSDLDVANILSKMVEDVYANILLNTRESTTSQITDVIQKKINELKNTFAIMGDCKEMGLKGDSAGCELTDADFRALKPNRFIEKWLLKQLLKRILLDCGNEAAYWIRQ